MKKESGDFLKPFILIASIIFLADRLTKFIVYNAKPDFEIMPSLFALKFTTNTGISFGLLKSLPIVPVIVSIVVIAGIILYYKKIPLDYYAQTGFALIRGGAFGNLADRLFYGLVIDFISLAYWPAFNIADSAITIGAILLMVYVIKENKE